MNRHTPRRSNLYCAPDLPGLGFHMNAMDNGLAVARWRPIPGQPEFQADVVVGFSESPEHQVQVIGSIQNGMVYTL